MPQPEAVRVPADVERPDTILFGLTLRQAVIVAATLAMAGGLAWMALRLTALPLAVGVGLAIPIVALGMGLALGQRDGLSLDRWVWAALRQARTPRHLVAAPEGIPEPPAWLTSSVSSVTRQPGTPRPAALHLPTQALSPHGVLDLGADGAAVVCRATPVNLKLRTPEEQAALTGAFARFLHQLTGPAQVLMRAQPVELAAVIAQLTRDAATLPHPALETAARQHAAFLGELPAQRDVLGRDLLVIVRDPAPGAADDDRAAGLLRRAQEGASLLAVAGVTLTPLDATQAAATLATVAPAQAAEGGDR